MTMEKRNVVEEGRTPDVDEAKLELKKEAQNTPGFDSEKIKKEVQEYGSCNPIPRRIL